MSLRDRDTPHRKLIPLKRGFSLQFPDQGNPQPTGMWDQHLNVRGARGWCSSISPLWKQRGLMESPARAVPTPTPSLALAGGRQTPELPPLGLTRHQQHPPSTAGTFPTLAPRHLPRKVQRGQLFCVCVKHYFIDKLTRKTSKEILPSPPLQAAA